MTRTSLASSLLPVLSLLALTAPRAADVLVVDPANAPGADFSSLRAAIAAAAEGDVLLLRELPGFPYPEQGWTISGKSLALFAEGDVLLRGELRVSDLAAGQSVLLSGIRMDPANLVLSGNAGHVRLQDLDVSGTITLFTAPIVPLVIEDCASVALFDCRLRGPLASGVEVVRATGSSVHLFGCDVEGPAGASGDVFTQPPTEGGPGLVLDGGLAHLAGCTVRGGPGGVALVNQAFPGCLDGGPGGPGVRLTGADPRVVVRGSVVEGGAGGATEGLSMGCSAGPPGPAFDVQAGTVETLPGAARTLSCPAIAREGDTITLGFGGEVGDLAFHAFSPSPTALYLNGLAGSLLLLSPRTTFVGLLSAPTQEVQVTLGDLPPDQAGTLVHQQAAAFPGTGRVLPGGGRTLLWLDAGVF